jgi:hypothetical protein
MVCMVSKFRKMSAAVIAAVFLFSAHTAAALDAAKDRRGLFWGMGVGGNGSVAIPGSDVGGGFNFDIQLGAGASQHLTLGLDVDVIGVYFESQQNIIFCPGPELNYFILDTGLFIRAGVAAALSLVKNKNEHDTVFDGGFDAGIGFGWEFFANTNLALGIALEADYMLRNDKDLVMFGFMFDLKYY